MVQNAKDKEKKETVNISPSLTFDTQRCDFS